MSRSPVLPWEVIERVIDHSAKNTGTLHSFTLTCRDLRPRSTILLLGCVKPRTRNQLFDLCDLLQAKPHLLPCVRSVSMPVHEFSPHPLLRILPNLSEIEFTNNRVYYHGRPVTFHTSVLTHCRLFGQHIRTLSLQDLFFPSLSTFSDILLSLPSIESLSCESLHVKDVPEHAHQELIARHLSERLHLRTLAVIDGFGVSNTAVTLLIKAAMQRLVTLTLTTAVRELRKQLLGSPSDWVQLKSLTWSIPYTFKPYKEGVQHILEALEKFRPPNLQEVNVVFHFDSPFQELLVKSLPAMSELCTTLDETLIKFPEPTISFSFKNPLNGRRYHSWMSILRKFFPALAERKRLDIDAEFSGHAGHDYEIRTPIITLSDSRWAATGSSDGTIIIWDLQTRCISQEWFAEEDGVVSLACSPDGRYIMSGSLGSYGDSMTRSVTVWDLHQDRRRHKLSLMKEVQVKQESPNLSIPLWLQCAWSPDGRWIAVGHRNSDGTDIVHIWETTTFQRLHSHSTKGTLLAFSADGRRVATTAQHSHHDCSIWDVESGKLHRSLSGHTDCVNAVAFNSGGTRVATGSHDSTTRIWDAKTGEQLLVLGKQEGELIATVAFSGDGRMVLSASCNPSRLFMPLAKYQNINSDWKVWDASNGTLLASLWGTSRESHPIHYGTCFSLCGSYIATASNDGAALLWRTGSWACIAKVSGGGGRVTHVAISPDGRVLCCGTDRGTVFFRRMHDLISARQD